VPESVPAAGRHHGPSKPQEKPRYYQTFLGLLCRPLMYHCRQSPSATIGQPAEIPTAESQHPAPDLQYERKIFRVFEPFSRAPGGIIRSPAGIILDSPLAEEDNYHDNSPHQRQHVKSCGYYGYGGASKASPSPAVPVASAKLWVLLSRLVVWRRADLARWIICLTQLPAHGKITTVARTCAL
jgi:hypothetical protein